MIDKDNIKLQYFDEFEYAVLPAKTIKNLKDKLNDGYGKEGWEVVCVKEESDWYIALLKRKLVTVDIWIYTNKLLYINVWIWVEIVGIAGFVTGIKAKAYAHLKIW